MFVHDHVGMRVRIRILFIFSSFSSDTAHLNAPSNEIQKIIENTTVLRICLDTPERPWGAAGIVALFGCVFIIYMIGLE